MARPDRTTDVLLAFRGHPRGPYRWLWEHYPELAEAKRAGRRPDWRAVTKAMSAMGVRAAGNRPLKADTVRRAWRRVEEDVERLGYYGAEPRLEPEGQKKPEVPPERSGGGAAVAVSAEPEQPRRRFRKIATFRGEEEG